MGAVGAGNNSLSQQYCGWLARIWARSEPITFYGARNTVVGWKLMGEWGTRNTLRTRQYCGWLARLWTSSGPVTFHGASNTVFDWYSTGRGRSPQHITEPAILWLAGTVMSADGTRNISQSHECCGWMPPSPVRSGPVTFHAGQQYRGWHALLWAWPRPVTFYGASNTLVGWHCYGRGWSPALLCARTGPVPFSGA